MYRKPRSHRTLFYVLLLSFSLLLNGQALAETAGPQNLTNSEAGSVTLPPLCRFGVNDVTPDIAQFDTAALRLGWYINYRADSTPVRPYDVDYAPMIRLGQPAGTKNYTYSPSGSTLTAVIAANPGAIWMIGNEPDRVQFQDSIEPDVYARAYHDLYALIKAQDPSARIYAGSIVQATAVRLQYLDLMLASYRAQYGTYMPVDGWSIHGFILNEVRGDWGAEIPPGVDVDRGLVIDVQQTDDLDLFKSHVVNFRSWMKRNGYRNVPLAMSEYGVLIPKNLYPEFDEGRVNAFMDATFDYLLTTTDAGVGYPKDNNRLVQRLSWYSTADQEKFNGHLYDTKAGNQLSLMGQNYARYTQKLAEATDFYPVSLITDPPVLLPGAADNELMLMAEVTNAGNNQDIKTADVRFYLGDPDAGGELLGTKAVSLRGCGQTTTVSLAWPGVAASTGGATPAAYDLFVRVEATNAGIDVGSNDPNASFKLYTDPQILFLPITSR